MPLGEIRTRNPASTGIGPKGSNLVNSVFALNCFKNRQDETDKPIIIMIISQSLN